MAAAKSNIDAEKSSKLENDMKRTNKSDVVRFKGVDIFMTCLSMGTFIADLTTDIILVIEYYNHGYFYWSLGTLLLIIIPAVIVQVFSMRWHFIDETVTFYHWLAHVFLLGVLQRHVLILKTGYEVRSSGHHTDIQRLYHQQSDICMLHLFECFMESAPQLVLQLYIMITLEDFHSWTGVSAAASLVSLAWAIAAYTRAMRRARQDKSCISWPGIILQAMWRGGMITARIFSLVLFAVGFQSWIFFIMGFHWLGMTIWIMYQKTDFCQTPWEECFYNCVVGMIYCFCFFNIREGRSRNRVLIFYTVIILENILCVSLYASVSTVNKPLLLRIFTGMIVTGTVLGISSMLLYYRFSHPAGPIKLFIAETKTDIDEPSKTPLHYEYSATLRSLKHMGMVEREDSISKLDITPPQDTAAHHGDESCADNNSLLTHCVATSNIPFESCTDKDSPVVNSTTTSPGDPCIIQISKTSDDLAVTENFGHKRRGICSPISSILIPLNIMQEGIYNACFVEDSNGFTFHSEPSLNPSKPSCGNITEEVKEDNVRHKRHAICSTADLNIDESDVGVALEEAMKSNEVSNFKSVTKSTSDEKINTSKESIAALTPSEGDDSPSEVLSVPSEVLSAHDYENMCAVNIAREKWGLRSWRGYSDIETWLHDDSVVRDPRRDTLASTATIFTSTSSENSTRTASSSPPPPLPCRLPMPIRTRQDDYMDTLVYDLADCEANPDFVTEAEAEPGVFVARPYLVDQHGTLFPLTTLDTIIEELEECSTSTGTDITELHNRTIPLYGSASTLVATIDEIRRGDSICNIYSSTEPLWSPRDENYLPSTVSIVPQSRLSPEEIHFLSKLRASPEPISPIKEDAKEDCQDSVDENFISVATNDDRLVVSVPEVEDTTINKKRNRPRRKFSLIREKFEPKKKEEKTERASVKYTQPSVDGMSLSEPACEVISEHSPIVFQAKENYTSIVPSRIMQWNSFLKTQNSCNSKHNLESCKVIPLEIPEDQEHCKPKSNFTNLHESRSMFLKQVLSPSKFQTWGRKSVSPSSKVVPAS